MTLDTSGIYAALDRDDPNHPPAARALTRPGRHIVPVGILAEVTYVIEARLGNRVLDAFLADIEEAAFLLDCGEDDIPRVRALITRYADLPLGYADAAVVACAERNGGAVLSYDRDLWIVAREGTIVPVMDDESPGD